MATVLDLMRTPPNLAVALRCASSGFLVFPCHSEGAKAKAPRIKGWQEAATAEEVIIREWWRRWPDSLVGLHLEAAGLIAIDADRHGGPDGVAAWEELSAANGFDPAAFPAVETPGQGRHIYMRGPAGIEPSNGRGALPPGVDVRAAGYTIASGCELPDGRRYEPAAGTPPVSLDSPEAPPWLVAMLGTARRAVDPTIPVCDLDTPANVERAVAFLASAPPAIEGQGGDETTLKVACVLKDFGLSSATALDLMAEHWNDRCAPPWQLDELAVKVENAYRYGQNPPGILSPTIDFAGVELIPPRYIVRKSRLRWLSDADAQKQPDWLLRQWLPEIGVATIAGQSRVAKSFIALDLAHALAMGEPFFHKTARERVGVLFVAAEAPGTIGPRLEALRLYKLSGVDPDMLPVAWVDLDDVARPPDLSTRVATIIRAIEQHVADASAEMRQRFGLRLGAVMIDTAGAAFGVADSDDEAAKLVMGALGVLSRKAAALIMPVAHFGKDDRSGIAGSYYWTAAADVVFAVTGDVCERTGDVTNRRIAITKNKLDEQGPISAFELQRVNLGLDRDGAEVTSAVVKATIEKPKAERPSPHADLYRECLFNAMVDKAVEIDGRAAAERRAVLALFRERKPGSKDSGNVSRAFAAAERWAGVTVIQRDGVDYVLEDQWPVMPSL
jgi:hypothetical protein